MSNIIRLNKPCPCGSGEPYRDCCAPKKNKRPHAAKTKPPAAASTSTQSLSRFFSDFAEAHDRLAAYYVDQLGPRPLEVAINALEVLPADNEPEDGLIHLFQSWLFFRSIRTSLPRKDVTDHLRKNHGFGLASFYQDFDQFSLAAFELKQKGSTTTARFIDGRDPQEFAPTFIVDHQIQPFTGPRHIAAWYADLGDISLLFYALPVPRRVVSSLKKAARRKAWGTGDDFRREDFEEDLLALLINPRSFDTGRQNSRIFLAHQIGSHVEFFRHSLAQEVASSLYFHGFRYDPIDDWEDSPYYEPDPDDATGFWAIDAAQITPGDLDETHYSLHQLRLRSLIPFQWQLGPIGVRTAEFLLPTDEILAWMHLDPAGNLDHPRDPYVEDYPAASLDVEPRVLRQAGVDPSWPIAQAIAFSRRNSDEITARHLEAAAQKFQVTLRFGALVARSINRETTTELGAISLAAILAAISELFPASLLHLPLATLPDPGRGTWARIERALRKVHLLNEGEPLTLARLPPGFEATTSIPGIGTSSAYHLWRALAQLVIDWPESVGHHPLRGGAEVSAEAAAQIRAGLDKLEDLF